MIEEGYYNDFLLHIYFSRFELLLLSLLTGIINKELLLALKNYRNNTH